MIQLLLFLRVLTFHSWAFDRAEIPQDPPPLAIGGAFSVPSLNAPENLPSLDQPILPTGEQEISSSEELLFKNDPLLGRVVDPSARNLPPLREEADSSQAGLMLPASETPSLQTRQGLKLEISSSFKKLRSFFLAASPHAPEPSSSAWDGDIRGSKDVPKPAPMDAALFARGPPRIVEVQNAAEVEKAIPDTNGFLRQFREQLMEEFWRGQIKSARVYTYFDQKGGSIITVDVSHAPRLLKVLPKFEAHEKSLIESLIASGSRQVQVILIEGSPDEVTTPDLILDGGVAEMKSLINLPIEALPFFLNKANSQLYKHAERHDLGAGTVVLDLTDRMIRPVQSVPVDQVLRMINDWARAPAGREIPQFSPELNGKAVKEPVATRRVIVFAHHDKKVFTRRPDGSFELDGK